MIIPFGFSQPIVYICVYTHVSIYHLYTYEFSLEATWKNINACLKGRNLRSTCFGIKVAKKHPYFEHVSWQSEMDVVAFFNCV